jgi:hypothetical protein
VQRELVRQAAAGASRRHQGLLVVAETLLLAALSVGLGWIASIGVTALAAAAGDAPLLGVLSGAQLSAAGLAMTAGALLAAVAALSVSALSWLPPAARTAVEAGVVAATLALMWQAASRGALTERDLADGGLDPVLVVLPALALTSAAAVLARLAPPALRLLERMARGRGLTFRLAALSLSRRPEDSAAVVSCLLAGVAVAVFAASYASTLEEGEDAGAAFRTPADVVVRQAESAQRPLPPSANRRSGAVIRAQGEILGRGGRTVLLGVPSGVLTTGPAAGVAPAPVRDLRPVPALPPLRLAGEALPEDVARFDTTLVLEGSTLIVGFAFQRRDGAFVRLNAPQLPPGRHRVRLPTGRQLSGARLVAVEGTPPLGAGAQADEGVLTVGFVRARRRSGGAAVRLSLRDWEGTGRVEVAAREVSTEMRFALFGTTGLVAMRRRQPLYTGPVPAIASAGLSREVLGDRTLRLTPTGGLPMVFTIVGFAKRFPTVAPGREFLVADASRLFAAANAGYPGVLVPTERWASARTSVSRLVRDLKSEGTPADRLGVRRDLRRARAEEPLAVGFRRCLAALWLLGGVAAVAGLAMAVGGWTRLRRSELLELEASGVAPGRLRDHLLLAAAILVGCAAAGGVAAAAALAGGVGATLELAADGSAPPVALRAGIDAPAAVLTVVAVAVVGLAGTLRQLRTAFAGDHAGRSHG